MSLRKLLAVGVIALTLPMSALAASKLKVNGFTTAGFSITDTAEQYTNTDEDGSFEESTFMGLQMRFAPNKKVPINFVTQFIARARDKWDMTADWAYVGWEANDSLTLNVGRIKAPIFMISEAYDVGVTYPWINPPEEIYGFANVPFTSLTGMSLDYNYEFDESWVRVQFYLGRDDVSIPALGIPVAADVTRLFGLAITTGTDLYEVRFAVLDVDIRMDLTDELIGAPQARSFLDGLSAAQVDGALALLGISNNMVGTAGFASLSGRYTGDNLLLMAEIAYRPVDDIPFPETDAGFVTVAYTIGKWQPHLTFSKVKSSKSDLLNQSQESVILGVRYNIQPWAALKIDFQHTELANAQARAPGGPLSAIPLTSSGLFNEFPNLATFTADVPQNLNKLNIAITMVF